MADTNTQYNGLDSESKSDLGTSWSEEDYVEHAESEEFPDAEDIPPKPFENFFEGDRNTISSIC